MIPLLETAPATSGRVQASPRVRRVEPRDLPELVELCRLHAAYEGCPYREDGQAERLAEALFGTPARLHGWVVETPDRANAGLDGYMTATIDFATWSARPFLHLDCLYLRDTARRAGNGRALMERLQAFARERGLGEIQWQTPPDNALGIGFYERIGASARPKLRFFLDPRVTPEAKP